MLAKLYQFDILLLQIVERPMTERLHSSFLFACSEHIAETPRCRRPPPALLPPPQAKRLRSASVSVPHLYARRTPSPSLRRWPTTGSVRSSMSANAVSRATLPRHSSIQLICLSSMRHQTQGPEVPPFLPLTSAPTPDHMAC